MHRVSALRPLVAKDPAFPLDRALHSVKRGGVLVYPSANAVKNYDNCANCASSRQACITDPPYSLNLCQKCSRQCRTKCPPHMSTTDAALWKKRDKEKRSKNKVKGTADKAAGADTEASNPKEIGTAVQSVPPEESPSNQPENVTECKVGTGISHSIARHTFDLNVSLEETLQGSQPPPDIHPFESQATPENGIFKSNFDSATHHPRAGHPIDTSPSLLWPDDQRFLTNLNLFS